MQREEGLRVILLGALSGIALATARLLAPEHAHFVLAGRNSERLQQTAEDLKARGAASCYVVAGDLAEVDDVDAKLRHMTELLGGRVDVALLFYGILPDQAATETDLQQLRRALTVNFSSAAEWCVAIAGLLERQDHGTLVAITSVAGDRGRQSNYSYGAAKAGLTVLVQGISHRLANTGARAVAVKLGFVDTPMTAHIRKGGPLWATPGKIAIALRRIIASPTSPIVYMPSFWRPIMFVVRNLPISLFHRTKL